MKGPTTKASEPLTVITLRLYTRDVELLRELFPNAGYNKPVREIIRTWLNRVREKLPFQTVHELAQTLAEGPADVEEQAPSEPRAPSVKSPRRSN